MTVLYFGKIRVPGHYFWADESQSLRATLAAPLLGLPSGSRLLHEFDGRHVPASDLRQGAALYSRLDSLGRRSSELRTVVSVVAWRDFTADRRPGSNSAFLCDGHVEASELIERGAAAFPSVWARQAGMTLYF